MSSLSARRLGRCLSILLCCALPTAFAQSLTPPVVAAMNPAVLAGKRPTVAAITEADILQLPEQAPIATDLVTFAFVPERLSSVQMAILRDWIAAGGNPILLQNADIAIYGPLFGLTTNNRIGQLVSGRLREPLQRDCQRVLFGTVEEYFERYFFLASPLPNDLAVLAEDFHGHPVCGSFTIGRRVVYFCNAMQGPDARRCILNFQHWTLALPVPPATSTPVPLDWAPTPFYPYRYR